MPKFTRKRRRLVMVFVALLGLVAGMGIWNVYDQHAWLQAYVVRSLQQRFGETVRYDSLQVQWRGVDLYGVEYHPARDHARRFFVRADEVAVRFGYWDLLRHYFQPEQSLLRVSVLQPTLYLSKASFLSPIEKNLADSVLTAATARADSSWQELARQYRIIETVELNHGRIVLQEGSLLDEHSEVLREINGWVRDLGNWKAQLKIHGRLANLQNSELTLSTEIDLRYIALDSLALKVEDWRHRGPLPLPVSGKIEMTDGALHGRILFARAQNGEGVRLDGELRFRDGRLLYWADSSSAEASFPSENIFSRAVQSLRAEPVRIDSLQLFARLQNGWLVVDSCRHLLHGQPLHWEGRMHVMSLPMFRALQEVAQRALPPANSAQRDSTHARPAFSFGEHEIDLKFFSADLAPEKLFANVLNDGAHVGVPPISGLWQLSGSLYGALQAPRVYFKLSNQQGRLYDRRIHHFESEVWYEPEQHLDANLFTQKHELRWQGSGSFGLSAQERGARAHDFDLAWEGWGKIDLRSPQRPLDFTILAEGDWTLPAAELWLMASDSSNHAPVAPRLHVNAQAGITGSMLQPRLAGTLECGLMRGKNVLQWLGDFTLRKDTLLVQAQRADRTSQLSAQIWRWGKQPLFRVEGLEAELLSTWLGEEWARSIATDFDFDFALTGHLDSLTLHAQVAKKSNGAVLLKLNGYMLPLVKKERVISGALQFFPQRPNGFTANYTCHVHDSAFTISELRSENWLSGSLRVQTKGRRELQGNLRWLAADMARLLGNGAVAPNYRGQLSGELKLQGTLEKPLGEGSFWLYDGFFNGVGNFFARGEAVLDSAGWRLDVLKVEKDRRPYLNAYANYTRPNQMLQLQLQGAGIASDEFLYALAEVPREKFHGVLSFELNAQGLLADFLDAKGVPLTGKINVRDGAVRWFNFDELEAKLDTSRARTRPARISQRGMYLPDIVYRKHGAFDLFGKGFLPFNNSDTLDITAEGEGDFLALLPEITTYFKNVESTGKLNLHLLGPYKKLRLPNSHLAFSAERVQLTKIAPEIREVRGELAADERGTFVEVRRLQGKIGDATLQVRNAERVPPLPMTIANDLLSPVKGIQPDSLKPRPLRLSDSQIYLGALFVKSSENGVPLNIPGLMQKHETGRFWITGLADTAAKLGDADEFIISGPWKHPVLSGKLVLQNVNFQFPFEQSAETDSALLQLMMNLNWNVLVESRRDNRYVISIPSAVDEVYVSLGLDDTASKLKMQGVLVDSSFFMEGKITSHRGVVEYLDMSFQVENCGAEFDRSDWRPIVYGRGHTVITDSTNFPYNVYLTLYTSVDSTGQELPRGRFQDAYFRLSSDHPNFLGDTQEQLLATLGYSAERFGKNAKDAVGIGTDNLIIRPFIRPVERVLERKLGLDVVRFSSRFTRNLLTTSNEQNGEVPVNAIVTGRPSLLRSSRLTLGKHLSNSLYLLYVGQVETGLVESELANAAEDKIANLYYNLQLRHRLGLEYRLNPSMLLQFEYDYNPLLSRDKADPRIWLRHSFPVEFPLKDGK